MLSPHQIRRLLDEGAAAVVRGDRAVLDETASWLTSLTTSVESLSDRALTVRVIDHVGVIREAAAREVLRRTTLS